MDFGDIKRNFFLSKKSICFAALHALVFSGLLKYEAARLRLAHGSFADPSSNINNLWRKPREKFQPWGKNLRHVPLLI
jgi:hypothetical protein